MAGIFKGMLQLNKRAAFLFLSLLLLLTVAGFPGADADLQCSVAASCSGNPLDNITVFRMSALSDAHAEIASRTNFGYHVCCGGLGAGVLNTDCDTIFSYILYLSSETNAHVWNPNAFPPPAYPTAVCMSATIGEVYCTISDNVCPAEAPVCLASISADTNAHVGDCNAYTGRKVCCRANETTAPNTTIDPNSNDWVNANISFRLFCNDSIESGGSGCAKTYWELKDDGADCDDHDPADYDNSGVPSGAPLPWVMDAFNCSDGSVCEKKACFWSEDVAGNKEDPKNSVEFRIDRQDPAFGEMRMTGFANYSGAGKNYINGTGTVSSFVNDGTGSGVDTSACSFTENGGSNWVAATYASGRCEAQMSIANGNTYYFNLRVADNAGNLGYGTQTEGFTGDTLGPAVGFDRMNLPPGGSVTINASNITCNDGAPGSVSGCNLSSIKLRIYEAKPASCPSDYIQYDKEPPFDVLSPGNWACAAVKDNVGNPGFSSSLDLKGPGAPAPVISPTHSNPGIWYASTSPAFNWTIPDDESGIKGYSSSVDAFPDTAPDGIIDQPDPSKNYTTVNGVGDGVWYFHVRAVDNSDNWGPAAHFMFRVDARGPWMKFTPPLNMTWSNTTVQVEVNLTDDGCGLKLSRYNWSQSTALPATWSADNLLSGNSVIFYQGQPSEGVWYLHVQAGDKADNFNWSYGGPYRIDTTPPYFQTIGNDPEHPRSYDPIRIIATAADSPSNSIQRCEVDNGTGWRYMSPNDGSYGGSPEVAMGNIGTFSEGDHTIQVRCTDAAGNTNTPSYTYSIHVERDEQPPQVDVRHSPEIVSNNSLVLFGAEASDPSGISRIQIYIDGVSVWTCTDAAPPVSPCIYIGGPYYLGQTHTYNATAFDEYGNQGISLVKTFTVSAVISSAPGFSFSPIIAAIIAVLMGILSAFAMLREESEADPFPDQEQRRKGYEG